MSTRTRRLVVARSVILAFVAGYYLGIILVLPGHVQNLFHDATDTGYFAAVMSLATLDNVERGDTEGAKRLLAQNVSIYCRSEVPDADPSRKAQLRQDAEKISARSPVLKELLAKPSP